MTNPMQTLPVKGLSDKKPPTGTPQNGELAEDVEKRFDERFKTTLDVIGERPLFELLGLDLKHFLAQEVSQAYQRGRQEERKESKPE